ncbi:sensor histidine kinase [Micromonospora pattaloongensis]|nr:nitrate- and nitrite sensing domain-containing protein [Micromonospora pattaloongensis]
MRDWRIGTKLGAVLVIPSVAFLVLAAVQTSSLIGQSTVLSEFSRQVSVGQEITALVHELQQERDRSAGELAGRKAAPERYDVALGTRSLQPHYEAVDRATEQFRSAADPLALGDAAWRVSYGRVTEGLEQLPGLRASVAGGLVSTATVVGNYTRIIEALLTLLAEPSPGAEHPELTEAVLRYVQLARIKEIGSRIRSRLYNAARAGQYGPEDFVELTDLRAQQLTALAEFRITATSRQVQRYQLAAADGRFTAALALEETTFASSGDSPAVLNATQWWSLSQDRHHLLRQVEQDVLGAAADEAGARSSRQLRETLTVAGAVLAVLLTALLTSIAIGRSIARSLRILRGQALQVAQFDLPDALERLRTVDAGIPEIEVPPAPIRSMDEIGEVAEAFVAVHRSAVSVAVEQAAMRRNVNAMFVNLARRSQVLVERQLELLDELEREESDPDQLDNLFKLDHLAARMRRNDESLLVLAGTEGSRRWHQPVALSAVMLAAMAEIEQYPRVRQEVGDDPHIVGHAVADLVHLLAELLENATAFSPPYTTVRMSAGVDRERGVTIEIGDEGLGMTEAALAQANVLLAAPPAADVAASERMGLFVVSHLAARQGIRVRLRLADRGVVAVVALPPALLGPAPAAPAGRTSPAPQAGLAAAAPRPMLGGQPAPVPAESVAAPAGLGVELGAAPARAGSAPLVVPQFDLPVAGRRPDPLPAPVEPPRPAHRADAIIASAAGGDSGAGSVWWERQRGPAVAAEPVAPPRPETPVTGGVSASGLPMRVPMAALPIVTESASPTSPAPTRREPDPDAVGSMLSRFYGGVRRAEAEDTTEITLAPAVRRGEEEQH